jgi:hypothetical protein
VRRSEEVAPIPAINGRPVISRADMTARGVPRTTVDGWYRDRAKTGYPEKAGRVGRTDYWYEDEWTAWYARMLPETCGRFGLRYWPIPRRGLARRQPPVSR